MYVVWFQIQYYILYICGNNNNNLIYLHLQTRAVGAGFSRVVTCQPAPTPMTTRDRNLHRFINPSSSLIAILRFNFLTSDLDLVLTLLRGTTRITWEYWKLFSAMRTRIQLGWWSACVIRWDISNSAYAGPMFPFDGSGISWSSICGVYWSRGIWNWIWQWIWISRYRLIHDIIPDRDVTPGGH